MSESNADLTEGQIVEKMSKHVAAAAILARFCLPLSKEDFLDLCGAAFDVVTVKADEFRKEFGDGKK